MEHRGSSGFRAETLSLRIHLASMPGVSGPCLEAEPRHELSLQPLPTAHAELTTGHGHLRLPARAERARPEKQR